MIRSRAVLVPTVQGKKIPAALPRADAVFEPNIACEWRAFECARLKDGIRLTHALVDGWMASYATAPSSVTLDTGGTCEAAHGHQQLSLFNDHYDERGFLPKPPVSGGNSSRCIGPSSSRTARRAFRRSPIKRASLFTPRLTCDPRRHSVRP
jgi:hypothetical protein